MKFMNGNRIARDGTPHLVASHLGIICLPMSHKKDTRLVRVNWILHNIALCVLSFVYVYCLCLNFWPEPGL